MTTRTVLITGANRGLGLCLARVYRERGDIVIGACRNPDTATALRSLGAETAVFDAGDPSVIAALEATIADRPVDVLINGAGIDARAAGASENERGALSLTAEQFETVLRVNVTAPLLVVQAALAGLRKATGLVVNVSSQIGSLEVAKTMGRDASYAASKAALNMLTLKQSQVLKSDGVPVVCLHPGWLKIDMGGSAADLDPADAARSIVTVADSLTIADTGRFIRWDGTDHPW